MCRAYCVLIIGMSTDAVISCGRLLCANGKKDMNQYMFFARLLAISPAAVVINVR